MAIRLHSNVYSPIISAGEPLTQNIAGRHFYYINGAGPIVVRLDNMPASILRPGQGIDVDAPDVFDRIEITNPAGTRMPISFWCGFTKFVDNRQDQVEARTEFVPVEDVAGVYEAGVLLAGAALDLAGTPTETLYRRKAVQICNLDPAVSIELRNSANKIGLYVLGGHVNTYPVSGFLRLKNNTGAGIACAVSEIWWTL